MYMYKTDASFPDSLFFSFFFFRHYRGCETMQGTIKHVFVYTHLKKEEEEEEEKLSLAFMPRSIQ
jgi:hypothetical protein